MRRVFNATNDRATPSTTKDTKPNHFVSVDDRLVRYARIKMEDKTIDHSDDKSGLSSLASSGSNRIP